MSFVKLFMIPAAAGMTMIAAAAQAELPEPPPMPDSFFKDSTPPKPVQKSRMVPVMGKNGPRIKEISFCSKNDEARLYGELILFAQEHQIKEASKKQPEKLKEVTDKLYAIFSQALINSGKRFTYEEHQNASIQNKMSTALQQEIKLQFERNKERQKANSVPKEDKINIHFDFGLRRTKTELGGCGGFKI